MQGVLKVVSERAGFSFRPFTGFRRIGDNRIKAVTKMMKKALKNLEKSAKSCYKNITWLKLGTFAGEANGSKLFFIDARRRQL